ncbi:Hypothetical transmembrane protein [Oceanicola granulosus HTCC2516]|uniref:Hypothetical transmembrane protein n=1 Tax=Oceanicola granulosus (strain ATCC BAA-861 / DSM 15982 / KCTC 12143 / HTCC2516) TaxID=314256 RepID=Q2CG41_OCEGH|nr:mechanosensitive ion channel domain-containing protein [Oceanicola granulosus]EAR51688.1 Hypothetical transmembrane protein [Oceanicola granulosus HTCC2516]
MLRLFRLLCLALLLSLPAALAAQQDGASGDWFVRDSLNAGLGPAPDTIDRDTPQAAMESFFGRAAANDWDGAAHLLDLTAYDPAEQAEVGPALARDLATLVDRKIVVNWQRLLDRPDSLNARAPSESAMAGEPRRSLVLWVLPLDDRPVSIRLDRVRAGEDDPVWVFSRQSVDNLPALAARYGPSRLEKMLPGPLREKAFWGLHWWEVILLPIAIATAIGAGVLAYRLTSRGLNRTRRDSGSTSFLVAIRPPAVLAVVTAVAAIFTQWLFVFSGRIDTLLSPLIAIGFVGSALWAIINVADVILDRLVTFDDNDLKISGDGQEKKRRLATHVAALRRFLIVLAVIVGAGLVLRQANMMQSFGYSLLASAGAITLILAFAARNVLANIMASLQIALNQSAKIGDRVMYQGNLCNVERINFTYVQLRTWTGKRLIVPVIDFVAEPFENWTMNEAAMIGEVRLRLSHEADISELRARYEDILNETDDVSEEDDNRGVYTTAHDVLGREVLFMVPCLDANTAWAATCEVRERLLDAAAELSADGKSLFPEGAAADATG